MPALARKVRSVRLVATGHGQTFSEAGRHTSVIAADETTVAHRRASSPIHFIKSCRERILGSIPSSANCARMSGDFNLSLIAALSLSKHRDRRFAGARTTVGEHVADLLFGYTM
jgi:hypothetical protein